MNAHTPSAQAVSADVGTASHVTASSAHVPPTDGANLAGVAVNAPAAFLGQGYSEINKIPMFKYGMIMADPPWAFKTYSEAGEEKAAQAQYDCMDLAAIKAMRVGDIASRDCVLWLWATNPMLPQAFEVMAAWGFQFKTAGHWSKKTVNGNQAFGTGYILRCAGEPFLIGTMGDPVCARNVRSVIEGPVREHSRKPEESYEAAERLVSNVDRMDFFSRQPRANWDRFGNEANKFEATQ
jgi:N6-adenosine-specific RNA methylase IME4